MIGRTVYHYRILEKLGEGGMGVVYKAHDTSLDRDVALKFLSPHLTSDPTEKERFSHEARAAAALTHANIAVVHEIGEHENQLFIAMEFVEGKTLKHLAESETLSVNKVLDIAIQVCEGLAAAHEKGIVHRDIKSDNIIVTAKGQAKIMDFGLAKVRGVTRLTQAGSTPGTAAYMSPEQARGEEVDHRSDIFSFGVVLYELLTRRLPFRGEHLSALMYSIINEQPQPVARFNNQVSAKLDDIVFKALAKNKEERYQHADDLLADLKRERKNLEHEPSAATTTRAEPSTIARGWTVRLLIGILGVAILAVVYFAFLKKQEPRTVSGKPSIAVLYLQNLSESKEDEYFAAGMTEDIITQLSKIGGLSVLSRSDVEEFKGKTVKLKEVADKLKVNYVMEGSVRKYGDKIRITCQLIKASDGFHVWADSYDRQMEDMFTIQADVAKSVAQALRIALAPTEVAAIDKKPTLNTQAYSYYLQGREYYFRGAGRADVELASNMYQKALQVDSNFALAYAGLSDCFSSYVMSGWDPKRSWLEKAEEAAKKALALDPNLAEAHRALSRLYWTQGESEKAIREGEKAVTVNPNCVEAWRLLGNWYYCVGEYPKAESTLARALEVKPTERYVFGCFIDLYSLWGNRKKAEEQFNMGTQVQPHNANPYSKMAEWCLCWGELERAKRMTRQALNVDPLADSLVAMDRLARIFMMSGDTDSCVYYLNEARRKNPASEYFVELAYLALTRGNKQQVETYADSCIQFNEPVIKEFKGMPYEYWSRLRIALACALKGDSRRALEQAENVRNSLGESLLSVEWAWAQDIVLPMSFVYSLTGEKEEAVRMLENLVKFNAYSPAYFRIHRWFRNLAGYPPYEKLIGRKAD